MARSIGFSVVDTLPCVNCCATADSVVPMPTVLVPEPFSAVAYTAANSARAVFAPKVLALAMLLPMTSRFLLEAFSPDRPCWKLMGCSWWGEVGSVEGLDGVVGHRARMAQFEVQCIAGAADGVDMVAHQRAAERRWRCQPWPARGNAWHRRPAPCRRAIRRHGGRCSSRPGPGCRTRDRRHSRISTFTLSAALLSSKPPTPTPSAMDSRSPLTVTSRPTSVAPCSACSCTSWLFRPGDRGVEPLDAADGVDLRHLAGDLRVVQRVQRVLVLHLRHQQLEEAVLAAGFVLASTAWRRRCSPVPPAMPVAALLIGGS